ncbi:hypothetical protein B0H14DRAFT_3151414, partial [Mycena olivaceomarginata]
LCRSSSPKQICSPRFLLSLPPCYPCCRHPQRDPASPGHDPGLPAVLRASVVPANSAAASAVAALVGLDLTGLLVDVGLSCSPITVVGNNCGNTTVTCDAPEKEWGSYEDAQTAAPLVFFYANSILTPLRSG